MPTSVAQIASASIRVTADTGAATRDLRAVKGELTSVGTAGQQAQGRLAGLRNAFGGLASGLGTLGLASMGLQAVVGAAQGAADALGVTFNAKVESLTTAFTGLLGSSQAAGAYLTQLQQFAARTPFAFEDVAKGAQRFIGMGLAAQGVIPLLTDVGNAVAKVGGGSEEINRVNVAISQIIAKGKVSAEEMNQLSENGIAGWKALADFLHVSVAQVMADAQRGAISAQTFLDAFHAANVGDAMAAQARTFNGAMSTITDSVQIAVGTAFHPLFDALSQGAQDTAAFVSSADFQTWGTNTATVVQGVLNVLGGLAGFISTNFVPIMTGLAVVTVPLLVSAMQAVIVQAPIMGAALWAATGPIGVLAVAVAALAVAWQNDFLGMRTATENLLQPVLDLQQGVRDLTGDTQRQAEGQAAVDAAWAARNARLREAAAVTAAARAANEDLSATYGRLAESTRAAADALPAIIANQNKVLGEQQAFVNRLGTILAQTGPDARSAAAGIADAFALLRETIPPGMEAVAADIQHYLETAKTGGTAEAQALNAQVTAELQALTQNADAATAAAAQAILDHFQDVLDNAAPMGINSGIGWIDGLMQGVSSGVPAIDQYVSWLLSTFDLKDAFAILGDNAAKAFGNKLVFGVSNFLNTVASGFDKLGGVFASAIGGPIHQMGKNLVGMWGDMSNQFKGFSTTIQFEAPKIAAAHATHAKAAKKGHKESAEAAANAARAQEKAAEDVIKDLGKAALSTTDSTRTIAQAYDDLLPILTAKLPAGLKWLQTDYQKMLGSLTSDTPPTLAQVHQQFDDWLQRLRTSQNAGWRLLAQSQIDAITQAELKVKEKLDQEADDAKRAADAMVASQRQAWAGLSGILQSAAKPENNLGVLMTQMLDLAQQATDAKMPALAAKLTGYVQQIADGSAPPLTELDTTFQAILDNMAAGGDLRLRAIAQAFRDTWATILKDQQAAAEAAAAAQARWNEETSAAMQKLIDDANAKRIADAAAMKQAQDQALADTLAWLQKFQQASMGLASGLGGVGKSLFDPSTFTKPGGMLSVFSSLGPLIQQALDAQMPGVAAQLRAWMERVAQGGQVPIDEMVAQIRAALESLAGAADPFVALLAQQAIAELNAAQAAASYTAAITDQQAAITATQGAIAQAQAAGQQIAKAQAAQQAVVQGLTEQYQKLQTEYQNWQNAQLAGTQASNNQQAVLKQQQGIISLALGDLKAAGGDTGSALAAFQQEYAQIKAQQDAAVQALQEQIAGASGDQKTTLQQQLDQLLAVQGGQQGALQSVMDALAGGGGADALQKLLDAVSGQASQAQLVGGLTTDPLKDIISGVANPIKEFDFSQILGGLTSTGSAMTALTPQIDAAKKQLDALGQSAADNQAYVQQLNDQLAAQQSALTTLQQAQQLAAQGYATLGAQVQTTTAAAFGPLPGVMGQTIADMSTALDPHLDPANEDGLLGKWATTPKSLLSTMYSRLDGGSFSLRPNVRLSTSGMMSDMADAVTDAMPGVTDPFTAGLLLMGDTAESQAQRVKTAIQGLNGMSVTISVSTETGGTQQQGQQQSGPPLGTNAKTAPPLGTNANIIPIAGGKGGAGGVNTGTINNYYINGVRVEDPDIEKWLAKVLKYTTNKNAGVLA